jgi:hypothetical protein
MKGRSFLSSLSVLLLVVVVAVPIWNSGSIADRRAVSADAYRAGSSDRLLDAYAHLPLAFVANQGQVDSRVRYYAQGSRYAFYFTPEAVVLAFLQGAEAAPSAPPATPDRAAVAAAAQTPDSQGVALALRFIGGNPRAVPEAAQQVAGELNYLRGGDPTGWQTHLPSYAQVAYRELWPGVDMLLHGQGRQLKYEFHVRPGARPSDIQLAYDGAAGLTLDGAGGLRINTALGALHDAPPLSYQEVAGERVPVASRYVLNGDGAYGFALGAGYDPSRELIIDPGVDYSTLIGGASHEIGAGIAVDSSGNAYLVGTTQSPNFPTTVGAFRRTGAASNFGDVFVSKLNPAGSALVYSTFIGGSDFDWGRSIAIDAAGNAYVTGQTKSSSFPTTSGAFDRTFNVDTCPRCGIDQYDAFALKLNAAGSALVYSTFLGGFDIDDGLGIAVDGSGSAYVTGETYSSNFPTTTGAFDRTKNANPDAFVAKLNAAGSALVYSTYFGGSAVEFGSRIAVGAGGTAYVMGTSSSADLPTTPGAFDTVFNGAFDMFVTKLNAAGSALAYSTFLGGADFESGGGLKVDAAGNAYISGSTGSADFPTTPGAFDTSPAGDVFVTKLNPAGSALVYSTALGGSAGEGANAVNVDAAGNAWVTGNTSSADFPITAGAFDSSLNGVADVFVSELNPAGSALLYSTYLGGANSESGNDLALDSGGNAYVIGLTYSIDFPTTAGAFDITFDGDPSIFWGDGFVTKFNISRTTSAPPSVPVVPAAPTLVSPSNGDSPPQPITFQWNIASGAATYTIQVDDSSSFSAPLVREQQNITDVRYAINSLATTQHFWRVRGVNTAGVAGAWSAVRSFTPQAPPPPAVLTSLDLNPTAVMGGNGSSGTVIFSSGAPNGGAVVALSSSNPAVASVPASITAPENSFTGTFVVTTSPVSANTLVTISASYNGVTKNATLTITPGAPPEASLQNLVVDSSVAGGSSAQGAAILFAPAPQGGAVVSLSSSNPAVASVPASVTVAAGTQGIGFSISTTAVSAATSVTITAVCGGVTKTATITVNPPAASPTPPPPPQTASLTVTASGRSGERITSSPAGISVNTGSSATAAFATGTSITLSVSGGRSAIWSGACSSGGAKRTSCTFTISDTASVTANVQ